MWRLQVGSATDAYVLFYSTGYESVCMFFILAITACTIT